MYPSDADRVVPSLSTFPEQPLSLCSRGHNVFLLLDVSGSIQGKQRLRRFNNQRIYTEKVMDAFGAASSSAIRFEIAAYSRFSAHVRALTNPRSNDIEYMKRSIKSFKVFTKSRWDTPNAYKRLTKKGKQS